MNEPSVQNVSVQTQTSSEHQIQTQSALSEGSRIVRLNVGGKLFVTSAQTLKSTSTDSFLSRIISGALPSTLDESGAYFVDRCPILFEKILTFLRTKRIRLGGVDLDDMLNEADFYGVQPLIERLKVCRQLNRPSCGNIAFCGYIPSAPKTPSDDETASQQSDHTVNEEVLAICATDKWIAVAYESGVACFSTRQFSGEACVNTFSPWFRSSAGEKPSLLALKSLKQSSREERSEQLIVACVTGDCNLFIWQQSVDLDSSQPARVVFIGKYPLFPDVNALVFAGRRQIVALNNSGHFSVWHYSRDFQQQKVDPICSFDECGAMMFFGHQNGVIRYFNAEILPVRLEDNKIILTDLYHDQENDAITALNVRLATNSSSVMSELGSMSNHFYFEIAYGTASGRVKLISEHAETIGQGPQLLFSFTVHRSPVTRILLSENHLVSNCADFNHVRCWHVSRFRGLLSKNPLPMPLTSFKMLHTEPNGSTHEYMAANPLGPHTLSESQVWYLQKITPAATEVFVVSALSGECIHRVASVDLSPINCFSITEEWRRIGNPTQYVFTGHKNGTIQVWNLAAAANHNSSNNVHHSTEPYHLPGYSRDGSFLGSSPDMHLSHAAISIKTPKSFYPVVPNELHPGKTTHPTVDDILKMLDFYDISLTPSLNNEQ